MTWNIITQRKELMTEKTGVIEDRPEKAEHSREWERD